MTALSALNLSAPLPVTSLTTAQGDYEIVRRILAMITEGWRDQPGVEAIADRVGLTTDETHLVFRRWCGLTPKAFLQAVTLDQAKRLLTKDANLLDVSLDLGLSGPARLHDLFVTHEAMSPGEWKTGGRGLELRYGYHPSPFGEALIVATARGLAGLGWVDDKAGPGRADGDGKPAGGRAGALADMVRRWPNATYVQDQPGTAALAARIFDPARWQEDQPLRVVMIGSDFEVRVWEQLLHIPVGKATTYGAIAARIGRPKAARPVGAAVGRNPLSFVVPCHRVLGSTGGLTGYHWGLTRKRAILGWETGIAAS
ncbi:MAG: bifunctional helix-turn-helix domain-containing protein/methylated-DNA--[protein]-cysteine S-methyltransferase [Hyphomicrobiales bacterium]|nr:bifunctional helix-turn-helix domain-containing protein/methylated-DNA--[protein]-cysteine S-methyltransferase [Hyphomicrobiales bacterium]